MRNQTANLFLVALLVMSAVPPAMAESRLYIALDTSGSMRNQISWLSTSILSTGKTLALNNADDLADFTLLGFTDTSDVLARGNATAISTTLDGLEVIGGTEDGFIPLLKIPTELSETGGVIVLVTNEDRDEAIFAEQPDVVNALVAANISVHAVLPLSLNCGGNKMVALEYTGTGIGDDLGTHDCGSDDVERFGRVEYAQIAFATGGTVWFLDEMLKLEQEFGEMMAYELLTRFGQTFRAKVLQSGARRPGSPITFDATITAHTVFDQQVTHWAWDFNDDGVDDDFGPIVAHIFDTSGESNVRLSMTDDQRPPVTEFQNIRVNLK